MLTLAELAADRADGSLDMLSVAGSCAVHGAWDIGLTSVATAAGRLCENSSLASTQKLELTGWLDSKRMLVRDGVCTMVQCLEGTIAQTLVWRLIGSGKAIGHATCGVLNEHVMVCWEHRMGAAEWWRSLFDYLEQQTATTNKAVLDLLTTHGQCSPEAVAATQWIVSQSMVHSLCVDFLSGNPLQVASVCDKTSLQLTRSAIVWRARQLKSLRMLFASLGASGCSGTELPFDRAHQILSVLCKATW